MSTKNLSRTVIEGGRYYGNCRDRRRSHQHARVRGHELMSAVARDLELFDSIAMPRPNVVRQEFHDKLAPADRWLRTQVNRPWNKVVSELMQRFDTRNLAGRHVVFDHMLPRAGFGDVHNGWRVDRSHFRVDKHGILRVIESPHGRWRRHWARDVTWAITWAANRKIGIRTRALYWLVPVTRPLEPNAPVHYRQARRLTDAEVATYEQLSDQARSEISIALT